MVPFVVAPGLYDQLAERPTEYEALTGAVVRFGRRYEIPTPMNDAIYALLSVASETAYWVMRWAFTRWPRGWRKVERTRRKLYRWIVGPPEKP